MFRSSWGRSFVLANADGARSLAHDHARAPTWPSALEFGLVGGDVAIAHARKAPFAADGSGGGGRRAANGERRDGASARSLAEARSTSGGGI